MGRTSGDVDRSFALEVQKLKSNSAISDRLLSEVNGNSNLIMIRTLWQGMADLYSFNLRHLQ